MKNKNINYYGLAKLTLSITFALVIFLWSLDLMTSVFQVIGTETVIKLLSITSNPFISLFIGIFITAVIQSSSTSTSLIVALVASGSVSLEGAIPMVMGANIGTTLTSTVVSLGYITNRNEFRNALTCGVMHDFFNILTVAILFPLEYYYNVLSKLSVYLSTIIGSQSNDVISSSSEKYNPLKLVNEFLIGHFEYKIFLFILSVTCLFASIKIISTIISSTMISALKAKFQEVFFKRAINSFGLGTLLTAASQSSSITTTIIIPLAVIGDVSAKRIFPYLIGANIGTTLTAIVAALNKSEAAMSIALAHFLFNGIGGLIFLFVPYIKNIPVLYARKFSVMISDYKIIGFFYILFIFFAFPLALIFVYKLLN